jgi:hypothetical protein
MLTESFKSIATASRQLLRNWRSMFLLGALYAALLATLYFFVTIKEATGSQVVLTLGCAILAPFFFFLLQTANAGALQTRAAGLRPLLKQSFRDLWKVVVISLPLLALALVAIYLLGKAQAHLGTSGEGVQLLGEMQSFQPGKALGKTPIRWTEVTFTTLRYLLVGFVIPLTMIHFWIAAARQGIFSTIKGIRARVLGAFAPQSVLIYMAGFLVFAVIPYLLLFKAIQTNKAWLELTMFVGRLCGVFALTLFGWTLTMGALEISSKDSLEELYLEDL